MRLCIFSTLTSVAARRWKTKRWNSQLLTLPDLVAYNVYHRFRYDKPGYPFLQRIKPYLYRGNGKLWGYGLKVFPDRKALPEEL